MRSLLFAAVCAFIVTPFACGGSDDGFTNKPQCNDGKDNDSDGMTDFPDDLGCTAASDESEDSATSPQCKDGRDNDDDGKTDYPSDPGCFAPQQDDEVDDCPDGPGCPQCADGMDNDMNGQTDWPMDTGGCTAASDTDEYTDNPLACGANVQIKKLPYDGHAMGNLDNTVMSKLTSPMCGGAGSEDVYELRIFSPKVVVASTDSTGTSADTVLYIRSSDCANNTSELTCNDDMTTSNSRSSVTKPISMPGTYYLVVDSHDSASGGSYDLTVKFLTGEGEPCQGIDDCGPGLVCRIPQGGTTKVCAKHICEDGVDDDGDGKNDYPTDPGCEAPTDDDEADSCPGVGPNCPECSDGADNDTDGKADYPMDTTCASAASASEACISQESVQVLAQAMTAGDTSNALNDTKPACGSSTSTAPDRTYRLDVPLMASLQIDVTATGFDKVAALYNSTCGGTAIQCTSFSSNITQTNLAAGTYYLVVDGYYDATDKGPYTIAVSGKIANGQSCEATLAKNGAITCGTGYTCKGAVGSRTCQIAQCSDGLDNDSDGKTDYPLDPGCSSQADDTETNPTTPPVCTNGSDDDQDGLTDYPADYGCEAAGAGTEVFCTGEMDPTAAITMKTTTGATTTGASNDWTPTCRPTSAASDKAWGLSLPVPVAALTIDTIGSGFDTVLAVRNASCTTETACDDDTGGNLRSKIDLANVQAGNYAIIVDGYGTNNGTVTLNVRGTVAAQTPCSSPLFSGGTNAVLVCPTGTTCTGTPLKCQ